MNKNRTYKYLLATLLLALVATSVNPVSAGSEDDAITLWTRRYNEALRDLRFGSPYEKISAAILMGGHRKSVYVRPLGAELLNHMEQQKFLKMSTNDPLIKTYIAWALGEIGHPVAIKDLTTALDIAIDLVKKDNDAAKELQAQREERNKAFRAMLDAEENKLRQSAGLNPIDKDDPYKIKMVTMGYDRPGPILNPGHEFPNSPDMYWSISDEFKGQSYSYKNADQRIRMEGAANWMNLVRAIFASLGKIEHEEAIEGVKKYLDNDNPMVRAYAAQALGNIGRSYPAAALILKEKFAGEKNERVKIYIAWAILVNDKSSFEEYKSLLALLDSPDIRQRFDAIRVLGDLAMGESEQPLREALKIEARPFLQRMLKDAIYRSKIDNIMPVNY